MKTIRFYYEEDAQEKLNEDFDKIFKLLNPYVQEYRGKSLNDTSFNEVIYKKLQNELPDGWILDANSSNAFIVRIGDGENEEKPFLHQVFLWISSILKQKVVVSLKNLL